MTWLASLLVGVGLNVGVSTTALGCPDKDVWDGIGQASHLLGSVLIAWIPFPMYLCTYSTYDPDDNGWVIHNHIWIDYPT